MKVCAPSLAVPAFNWLNVLGGQPSSRRWLRNISVSQRSLLIKWYSSPNSHSSCSMHFMKVIALVNGRFLVGTEKQVFQTSEELVAILRIY